MKNLFANLFAFLQPPPVQPDNTPEDIEIIVRRKRGHKQNWFSKLHVLIIEIIALLCLLAWGWFFIKSKTESPITPAIGSGYQQTR